MPSLHFIILFALVTLVLSAPHPFVKRSFKVERVPNPNFKRAPGHKRAVGAGTRALVKAHRKYSISLPPGLLESMRGTGGPKISNAINNVKGAAITTEDGAVGILKAERKTHSVTPGAPSPVIGATFSNSTSNTTSASAVNGTSNGTATSGVVIASPAAGDVEYLSPINIGGQIINLDIDSGSSDLWVFSSQLPLESQTGHTVFDTTKSPTFEVLQGHTYHISYGDGSFSRGSVYVKLFYNLCLERVCHRIGGDITEDFFKWCLRL